jgi:hypothetical protein
MQLKMNSVQYSSYLVPCSALVASSAPAAERMVELLFIFT